MTRQRICTRAFFRHLISFPSKWSVVYLVPCKMNSRTAFHLWLNGCSGSKELFQFTTDFVHEHQFDRSSKTINGNHGTNEKWLRFSAWGEKFFGQNSLNDGKQHDTTSVYAVYAHATNGWTRNNFVASKSLWKHKLCACMLTSEDFVILSCRTMCHSHIDAWGRQRRIALISLLVDSLGCGKQSRSIDR